MKKNFAILPIFIILSLTLILSVNNTYATCESSTYFSSYYCLYGRDYITPPSTFNLDVTLFGEWWALGSGSPIDGSGNDRGVYKTDKTGDWLYYYSIYCHYMPDWLGNWNNPGTDGCILDDPEEGPMVVSFDDRSSDGLTAFFAIACVERAEGVDYDFDSVDAPIGCHPWSTGIWLTEMPKPVIDSSIYELGGTTVDLTWEHPYCGFHSDGSPLCYYENIVIAYEIYYWQGVSEPTDRDASVWKYLEDSDSNFADNYATVFVPDSANPDESSWVSIRISYDSGFKSKYVGPSTFVCKDTDHDGYYPDIDCGTLVDCDDSNANVYPGAQEICDDLDNDCDGTIDNKDNDGDGFIDENCPNGSDCNDDASAAYPGGVEVCDDLDNDCDGTIDNKDSDQDGYIDGNCQGGTDCNDYNPSINPGIEEICDYIDNNCSGIIDEGFDNDQDGFKTCEGDCNDDDNTIHPWAIEICDGVDNDCDDSIDDGLSTDMDQDGHYTPDSCWGPQDDCNDANASIYPEAPEICNGYDDDCSGVLDEGCDTTCEKIEVYVPYTNIEHWPGSSNHPSMTWTGDHYGVAWNDHRDGNYDEIYFAKLDAYGNRIGPVKRASFGFEDSEYPSIVWTGSEYGIAWRDERDENNEIYFTRLDAAGDLIFSDKRITLDQAGSYSPSLVWTGTEYGVSWSDNRDGNTEIYFMRLAPSGSKISQDVRITENKYSSYLPSMTWTGSEYGISWTDSRTYNNEIYFARLDGTGGKIGSDIRISSYYTDSNYSSIVWTGELYGIAWQDLRGDDYNIFLKRLDPEKYWMNSPSLVDDGPSNSIYPSLTWTGSEFGVSWQDDRDENNEIYFIRIDSQGKRIGSETRITHNSSYSLYPSIAWTGRNYAVAWADSETGLDIYLAQINCCSEEYDHDGDSWCFMDCDDEDETSYPDALEICNAKDSNCDGTIDNKDSDNDGYYDINCLGGDDCDEDNPGINPGAGEILCNGIDEACDGFEDEAPDHDGDGYDICDSDDIINPDGLKEDCNDANAFSFPGAQETCNGFDEDCNGSLDDGCDFVCDAPKKPGSDVRMSFYDKYWKGTTQLAWTGYRYGIAWADYRYKNYEIYFASLDSDGTIISFDKRITFNSGNSFSISLVWTGNEYGMAWSDDSDGIPPKDTHEIYFMRLDSLGNKIDTEKRITYDSASSSSPSLVWTGNRYGVAWVDGRDRNSEIYFAKLDSMGNKSGSDERITYNHRPSGDPSLVWNGREYAVSWDDYRNRQWEIYFTRIDSEGSKIGSSVRITYDSAQSHNISLEWTGKEYGVFWQEYGDGGYEFYFAKLDPSGSKIGTDVKIVETTGSTYGYTTEWTGGEYGFSWSEIQDGDYKIFLTRMDSSGNKYESNLLITSESIDATGPSLAWTGKNYGVSWNDRRDGHEEIYFASLKCNQSPIADAGEDSQSECTSSEGGIVILNGSASADMDSTPGTNDDIVLFEWFEDFGLPSERYLGEGEIIDAILPLGIHIITLKVTDSVGQTDTDEVIKTVVDTLPPDISVSVDPDSLWPPNHRMVDIEAFADATDICGIPAVTLFSLSSDEPDNAAGNGDGNTVNDIQDAEIGTADFHFQLRAERDGKGNGRTYTVVYEAVDQSGNSTSSSSTVHVPHDKAGNTEPVQLSILSTERGTVIHWSDVEGAQYYDVIRGLLSNIQENDEFIDLGEVICIEAASMDGTTEGREDSEVPETGQVFIYLVEYYDELRSAYGTESASKPRDVVSGNCP